MIDYIGAPRSMKMRTTRAPRPMMPWPASRLSGRNYDGAAFRATPRLLIRNIGNRSALLCVNYFVTRPQPLMRMTMAAVPL